MRGLVVRYYAAACPCILLLSIEMSERYKIGNPPALSLL